MQTQARKVRVRRGSASGAHQLYSALVDFFRRELRELLEPCVLDVSHLTAGTAPLQLQHQAAHASKILAAREDLLPARPAARLEATLDLAQLLDAVSHDRLAVAERGDEHGVLGRRH